ncbi:MAG: hypothetical protein QN229_07365 [Desulfurococcaceae archaeon TW002]
MSREDLLKSALGMWSHYMTELQSFGKFWYRVSDPVLFLTQIADAVREISSPMVGDFIRNYFIESFIQEISRYTAIDIYSNLSEVTTKIKTDNIYDAFKQRSLIN